MIYEKHTMDYRLNLHAFRDIGVFVLTDETRRGMVLLPADTDRIYSVEKNGESPPSL